MAVATSRVGLIATASTTYSEPFNLARQFASIDHISNGRAAWNIVTSWLATAAENYGEAGQVSHADRYARGEEFMEVVKALWDSWASDAIVDDLPAGSAGPGAGGLVRHRSPLRGAACRSRVYRPYGEGDSAGILCRSEEAGDRRGTAAGASADPTRTQPDDRRD